MEKATALGIDAEAVAAGGLPAWRTLTALQSAADSAEGPARDRFLDRAQDALRALNPRQHGRLLQQFQARLIAFRGRGGDQEIAHVTEGEVLIPKSLQTPAVMKLLRATAAEAGLSLDRLRVGTAATTLNPETGAAEFADPLNAPMEEITVTASRAGFAPQPGDEEMLTRLIFSEGADHYAKYPEALPAIGWSVFNRIREPGFKHGTDNLQHVISASGQFNGYNEKHPDGRPSLWDLSAEPDKLTGPNKAAYEASRETARRLLTGELEDETGGAQFFHTDPVHPPFYRKALAAKAIERLDTIGAFKFFRNTRK